MMKRTLSAIILALLCASPALADTKQPAKPIASAEETAKAEKFFNEFADAIVKNQDACPKMGKAINGLIDANEAWLVKMAATDKELPQAAKDRIQKRQTEMISAVMKCKDDKDVTAAFQRFINISMKKAPPPPAKK
jgi:hypothetical protein